MEAKNQVSSSSLANDLFGAKHSPPISDSNDLFSSIFPASSAVAAKNYPAFMHSGNEHKLQHGSASMATEILGDKTKDNEGESHFSSSKETQTIFLEKPEPCPLSSSLYYGGKEDMYVESLSPHTPGPYTDYKKDDGVEDPSGNNSTDALTGNWWQGSLHY